MPSLYENINVSVDLQVHKKGIKNPPYFSRKEGSYQKYTYLDCNELLGTVIKLFSHIIIGIHSRADTGDLINNILGVL